MSRGNSYAVGANSEGIRSAIQNGWHNAMGWPGLRAIFGGAHLLIDTTWILIRIMSDKTPVVCVQQIILCT